MTKQFIKIGLVSIIDRASTGVYEDKGIPALRDWLDAALTTPWEAITRIIPDEQAKIEATLKDLSMARPLFSTLGDPNGCKNLQRWR